MISHDEFCKLRLREFCPGDDLYSDEEDEHGELLAETIRGIWFGRPITHPDETFIMDIDLLDYSTDAGPAILARVGLPFTRATTFQEVIALLGQPDSICKRAPDAPPPYSESCEFRVMGASGYLVRCTFLDPGAPSDWLPCYRVGSRSLWNVVIHHSDLPAVMQEIEQMSENDDA